MQQCQCLPAKRTEMQKCFVVFFFFFGFSEGRWQPQPSVPAEEMFVLFTRCSQGFKIAHSGSQNKGRQIWKGCYFWLVPFTHTNWQHSSMTDYHVRQLCYGNRTWFIITRFFWRWIHYFGILNRARKPVICWRFMNNILKLTNWRGIYWRGKTLFRFRTCFRHDSPCWSVWASN